MSQTFAVGDTNDSLGELKVKRGDSCCSADGQRRVAVECIASFSRRPSTWRLEVCAAIAAFGIEEEVKMSMSRDAKVEDDSQKPAIPSSQLS